jgi:glycerol-3-phosphate acyltransferase PlsY
MTYATFALAWLIGSFPVAMLVGRLLKERSQ